VKIKERRDAAGKILPGPTVACAPCHGADLRGGVNEAPPIAGRSPIYIYRQLTDIRNGARKGPSVEKMQPTWRISRRPR